MPQPCRDGAETSPVNPSDQKLRRLHYVQIDVFTSERLTGNPLTVFTDARGLSESEMQDLARETNDLKVGKVPVSFHREARNLFGEMKQVAPVFRQVHDSGKVAQVLGLDLSDFEPDLPMQTVSTGLPFALG